MRAQSCLTLCNLMHCNLPGSSVHGVIQARILEWVAISSAPQGSNLTLLRLLQWQAGCLPLSHLGSFKISISS